MSQIWINLFQGAMFSYPFILIINLNHSIRMSDGQVMAKIQSWSRKNRTEKLLEHNSTLNEFFEFKWVGIWIGLFQGAMLSYQSSLIRNLNHSIWMSNGQVMAKIQS